MRKLWSKDGTVEGRVTCGRGDVVRTFVGGGGEVGPLGEVGGNLDGVADVGFAPDDEEAVGHAVGDPQAETRDVGRGAGLAPAGAESVETAEGGGDEAQGFGSVGLDLGQAVGNPGFKRVDAFVENGGDVHLCVLVGVVGAGDAELAKVFHGVGVEHSLASGKERVDEVVAFKRFRKTKNQKRFNESFRPGQFLG